MNSRHQYHKYLGYYENIIQHEKCLNYKGKEQEFIIKTFNTMVNRTFYLSRAISILYETGLHEEVAILTRSLLEIMFKLGYMLNDKEKTYSRVSNFLSNNNYKKGLLEDMKNMNLPLPYEEGRNMVIEEKSDILDLLEIGEDQLDKENRVIEMAKELGFLSVYSYYYRHFSQYVHSTAYVFQTNDDSGRNKLGERSIICCTFCWLILSEMINEYFELNKKKEIRKLSREYRQFYRVKSKNDSI
ncbi:DUF5677 domain-containing protein [Niallia taxi]|uniref:DUF5677 domain-containing protein n=1 Tax=Niallia taxi TaxID=2499688 RepID=UPI00317A5EED